MSGPVRLVQWEFVHPRATMEMLGYIPQWFKQNDARTAKQVINDCYAFGGFRPFKGFRLNADNSLKYPGDPPMMPLAQTKYNDQLLIVYQHSWFAIIQPDGSLEVARLD